LGPRARQKGRDRDRPAGDPVPHPRRAPLAGRDAGQDRKQKK